MRKAARAIVIRDDELLIMHRDKFGTKYDTLPGGNVEVGESTEEAVRRELREETGLDVGSCRLVFIEDAGEPYGTQYVYLCDYIGGEPQLAPESEEAAINKLGKNLYKPMWVSLAELSDRPFKSETLKQHILTAVADGFTQEPLQI